MANSSGIGGIIYEIRNGELKEIVFEQEYNDTWQTANPLSPNTDVTGVWHPV